MDENKNADAVRSARNEYMKKWRAKNKDKIKQYNKNYWLRRANLPAGEVAVKEEET